jgi:hypothetical protein
VLHARRLALDPWLLLHGSTWTAPLKTLALAGGVVILAWTSAERAASQSRGAQMLGAALLGIFLLVCGLEHFAYTDSVARLIPPWIPGAKAWTYFASRLSQSAALRFSWLRRVGGASEARRATTLDGVSSARRRLCHPCCESDDAVAGGAVRRD